MKHDIIIIGAGASGVIAALTAKNYGADVALIDSNDRIGKKLLTTGNGRCNITNTNIENFLNGDPKASCPYHSKNKDFFIPCLKSFSVESTKDFFYSLGLPFTTLENGKMYPLSLQASSVLDILRFAIEDRQLPFYNNSKVTDIGYTDKTYKITASCDGKQTYYSCNKLIICTGGKSAPSTGSDGYGYNLAKKLGHSIINPLPALVQLKLDYKGLKAISGVKFEGLAEIFIDGISKRKEAGEILFTDYGISGPPILQISRTASVGLNENKKVTLDVSILPELSEDNLIDLIETRKALFPERSISESFIGIINKKLIIPVLKEAGISELHKPLDSITWEEQNSIIKLLRCWTFVVSDTNGFKNAQVTCGGVNTDEVDKNTLESKLCSRLYLAGELLDVDGDCGGFNLQWAWSSGYVAGKNAAK